MSLKRRVTKVKESLFAAVILRRVRCYKNMFSSSAHFIMMPEGNNENGKIYIINETSQNQNECAQNLTRKHCRISLIDSISELHKPKVNNARQWELERKFYGFSEFRDVWVDTVYKICIFCNALLIIFNFRLPLRLNRTYVRNHQGSPS